MARRRRGLLGAILFLISLAACGKGHSSFNTSNDVYATPTPAPVAAVLDQAAPLCDRAFAARQVPATGSAQGPVLVLLKLDEGQIDAAARDLNLNTWLPDNQPDLEGVPTDQIAATSAAAHTLICLIDRQVQTGTYTTTGSAAIRVDYIARLVSWPDGGIIAGQAFTGDDPPATHTVSGSCRANTSAYGCKNPVYGTSPRGAFGTWLQQQLGAAR